MGLYIYVPRTSNINNLPLAIEHIVTYKTRLSGPRLERKLPQPGSAP